LNTFDITQTASSLVALSGFGTEHPEVGYYRDGVLFAKGRAGEGAPAEVVALRKTAAEGATVALTERQTHIWWRFTASCDIPQTLAEYDAKTVKAFQTRAKSTFTSLSLGQAELEASEIDVVSLAYELAGGDVAEFNSWYLDRLVHIGSFAEHYAELERELKYTDSWSEACPAIIEKMEYLGQGYLEKAFHTHKPLDAVARRAWNR
jgi:hypothetical protein